MQIDKYIDDGIVQTGKIANDVRYKKLSHNEILEILNDSRVRAAFIGTNLNNKKTINEWNEEYLDELFGMASMTCFNEDYLMFLEKVSKYVSQKRRIKSLSKLITIGICVFLLIFILIGKCTSNRSEKFSFEANNIEVE